MDIIQSLGVTVHTHLSFNFTHPPQHADILQQISIRQHLLPQLLIYRDLPLPQDLIHPETHSSMLKYCKRSERYTINLFIQYEKWT